MIKLILFLAVVAAVAFAVSALRRRGPRVTHIERRTEDRDDA